MKKHIIHVNDKTNLSGGVEVYISEVRGALRQRGWVSDWVAITKVGGSVEVLSDNEGLRWRGEISELRNSPMAQAVADGRGLFHVHSLSEPEVLDSLFGLAPVVRTAHEPRMVCPGQGKFWARQEEVCRIPAGKHCLFHAYSKRCCNRHPKRLVKAYRNVRYERRVASRKYAKVLANSGYTEDLLLEAGFPGDRVVHLPLFASLPEVPSVGEVRSQRVLYVGRLSRTKGVHYLLEAIKRVRQTIPGAKLIVLGDGHDADYFKCLCGDLGLDDVVEFGGWADRAKVESEMAGASVVAFPSIYPEAFGLSGIEAMAHARPVVAFDVGGVGDWLRDGVNGRLVKAKDGEAYAEALAGLLADAELAERFGLAGRAMVVSEFNRESHMNSLFEIYGDV